MSPGVPITSECQKGTAERRRKRAAIAVLADAIVIGKKRRDYSNNLLGWHAKAEKVKFHPSLAPYTIGAMGSYGNEKVYEDAHLYLWKGCILKQRGPYRLRRHRAYMLKENLKRKVAKELAKPGMPNPGMISESLGVSHKAVVAAIRVIMEEWRQERTERLDELLSIELAKMDKIEKRLWDRALEIENDNPENDVETFLKAVVVAMRLQERRSRLLGLDKVIDTSGDLASAFAKLAEAARASLPEKNVEAIENTAKLLKSTSHETVIDVKPDEVLPSGQQDE